jgi:ketosteroid isomerase-like protein
LRNYNFYFDIDENFRQMRFLLIIFIFFQLSLDAIAQLSGQDPALVKLIDDLNRKIDRAVVSKDLSVLEQHYGDDFVFTHATGLVDSKNSWIESIKKNKGYAAREHDSTIVELHKDLAIIEGKLTVSRLEPAKDGTTKYSLKYVRVFALRKKNWEMISHRSTSEWHHD